ncbi:hypothetical protein [uncultured Clostridium sp.]|uniref:hypothetical protein n=1 Tax=uncultured Clostridium sp. TaxID=59620 RepID=UPI0025D9C764|nr:hypothetical protein [uncultured Clostridium sp.]
MQKVNPIGTEEFKFYVINNKESNLTSYWNVSNPGPYILEKYEEGQWKELKYKSGYGEVIPDVINILVTKTINLETVQLNKFEGFDKSNPGRYRITFYGTYESDNSKGTASMEFEIK